MRRFLQNKLWRNKIITELEAEGSIIARKHLDSKNFSLALKRKLIEECQEVYDAKNVDELKVEIADVLEVIDCLCAHYRLKLTDIAAIQQKKRSAKGTFTPKTFIEWAAHPAQSRGEEYCRQNPHKYPELH